MIKTITSCIFLLYTFLVVSQTPPKVVSENLSIDRFEYIRDVENTYTPSTVWEASFTTVNESDLNWGEANGWYWFKINLTNYQKDTCVFRLATVHTRDFSVYEKHNDSLHLWGISGNNIPINKKSTIARYAAVPVQIEAGQSSYYIHVFFKQEANFPLEIISDSDYDRITFNFLSLSGVYYGFALLILIISIGLFLYFKEKIYLSYAFFLLSITLSLFYDDGFFSYLFPGLINHFDGIEMFIHWVSTIAATLFCFAFLDIKNAMPWIRKWFWLFIGIIGLLYLSGNYNNNFYHYRSAGYVVYVIFMGNWLLSCYIAIKKTYARILVFAYLLVLFSSMGHYVLRVAGNQFIDVTSNEIKLGGIVEMLILGGGILYRFRFLQKENIEARNQLDHYFNELQQTSESKAISLQQSVDAASQTYHLSKRETEVLSELSKGYSNKQIAEALHISVATVKFHTSNIYEKLQVSNRFEVIEKVT